MPVPDEDPYTVELGPLFTIGVALLAYGVVRRKPLAAATGLGSIWLDQRSEFGRTLKKRVRSAMKQQIKAHARSDSVASPERSTALPGSSS